MYFVSLLQIRHLFCCLGVKSSKTWFVALLSTASSEERLEVLWTLVDEEGVVRLNICGVEGSCNSCWWGLFWNINGEGLLLWNTSGEEALFCYLGEEEVLIGEICEWGELFGNTCCDDTGILNVGIWIFIPGNFFHCICITYCCQPCLNPAWNLCCQACCQLLLSSLFSKCLPQFNFCFFHSFIGPFNSRYFDRRWCNMS